jgi:hypothetical protein
VTLFNFLSISSYSFSYLFHHFLSHIILLFDDSCYRYFLFKGAHKYIFIYWNTSVPVVRRTSH